MKILGPLVDGAHANPAAFANNQPLRERLLKGLIALLACRISAAVTPTRRRSCSTRSAQLSNTSISRQNYGPEAFTLFEDVKKQAQAKGPGRWS